MGKKIRIRDERHLDHISESFETIFWAKILIFFDAGPGSGMKKFGFGIRVGKNSDPG
jgi:hypothetical protein